MSSLKNPKLRYQTLDKCFRNTAKKYFIDDLVRECNKTLKDYDKLSPEVSKRQVWDDIKYLKSREGGGIELEAIQEGRRKYYRYADPTFSLYNVPLAEADFIQLQSAIEILTRFEGLPQFNWLERIIAKVQYSLPQQNKHRTIISFDNNRYLHGIEFLGTIFNSITYSQVLEITYQDFKSNTPYKFIIHPYYLKQYNNRWFFFGLNPAKGKSDWIVALDRVKAVRELSDQDYIENPIDWSEYFQNIIGVTKHSASKETEVILHFFGDTCNYVISKALHGSQKAKFIGSGQLEVRLELVLNFEFEQLILSFGENVQVVSPEKLVKRIKYMLSSAIDRYI